MGTGSIPVGSVVQSRAGKDTNALYVVVGALEGTYVLIADGRKYTWDKPKKKNCRHLRIVETSMTVTDLVSHKISNEGIRDVLNRFRYERTREVLHV